MSRQKRNNVLSILPSNWKEIVLEQYNQGASDTEIRAELCITPTAWYKLMDDSMEFYDTVVLGRQFAKAWWMKVGRTSLNERNFNAYLWYKNMQNRFAWSEKQQTNIDKPSADEEEGFDEDEADQTLNKLLNKAGLKTH